MSVDFNLMCIFLFTDEEEVMSQDEVDRENDKLLESPTAKSAAQPTEFGPEEKPQPETGVY